MEDLRTRLLAVIDDLTLLSIHAGIHPAAQAAHATDAERLRAELSKPELQCPWCVRDGRKPRALELQWVCEHCGYRGTADDYEHAEPTLTPKPEPGALQEWRGLWKCEKCGMVRKGSVYAMLNSKACGNMAGCSGKLIPYDRRALLPSPSALRDALMGVIGVAGWMVRPEWGMSDQWDTVISKCKAALNPDGRTP